MGILGLFKLKLFDPAEFEKDLTTITQSISQAKKQIAQLTQKKRTLRRTICTYCLAIYVSYVAYLYKSSLDNLGVFSTGMSRGSILVHGQLRRIIAGTFAAPFAMGCVVYLINFLFNAWIRSKNNTLKNLQKKHKSKLEELKQVTNFSKTNQLLRKFDGNTSDVNLPEGGQQPAKRSLSKPFEKSALQEKPKGPPPTANVPRREDDKASSLQRGNTLKPISVPGAVEPLSNKRSFQDRILDLIIGSDHNESVEQRYALICANCYTHNGLAPPGCTNPNTVTYICRHCGFINGLLNLASPTESGRSISPPSVTIDELSKARGQEILQDTLLEGSIEEDELPKVGDLKIETEGL